ncbi:hypothetical protein [Paractinoplanes toevensis]|uniref:Uncharacterized protein n=1 Tax=Paractinoplanes toevensis TaxID=571911 RepID=A0A919T8Z0_9ACTN|nr:hypothetical protein [Actinoplanes toevensis]GIM90642.1 hypothetical protein Ato02nite_024350 [Actinoplanes toevensis]
MNRAFWIGVLVSIVTGALVNEFGQVAPRLARRLVRSSARIWAGPDDELAYVYAEEWAAVIEAAPGQLTKLFHALRFFLGAAGRLVARSVGSSRSVLDDVSPPTPMAVAVPVVIMLGTVWGVPAFVLALADGPTVALFGIPLAICALCVQLVIAGGRRAAGARSWLAILSGVVAIGAAVLFPQFTYGNLLNAVVGAASLVVAGCLTISIARSRRIRAGLKTGGTRVRSLMALAPTVGWAVVGNFSDQGRGGSGWIFTVTLVCVAISYLVTEKILQAREEAVSG